LETLIRIISSIIGRASALNGAKDVRDAPRGSREEGGGRCHCGEDGRWGMGVARAGARDEGLRLKKSKELIIVDIST
jgi:hypothetical protein